MDSAILAEPALTAALTANAPIGTADKIALCAVSVACFIAWKIGLAAVGLPSEPHISTLLLHQGFAGGLISVISMAILMPVMSIAATAILGRLRPEAGVFCAALGLIALPSRGGDLRNTLLDAGSYSVFLTMAIEQILLWVIVGGALMSVGRVGGLLQIRMTETEEGETTSDRLTVIASQAAAVLIVLVFVGQSPAKGQAMVGVGLAGLLGALAIHQSYKLAGAIWYISGTMLAGLVAYLWCFFTLSGNDIGDVNGFLAGPARSLPLHYASIGVAGTIYGYWVSMTWQEGKHAAEA